MKLFKSKKGLGTSVIADVFALLAYFIFFIIVVLLIAYSGEKSKADVRAEALKVDYNLELLNGLRTPMTLGDGTNMTFAEYLSKYADTPLCNPDGTANTAEYKNFYDTVMPQMKPYFEHLKSKGACIIVNFGSDNPPPFAQGVKGQCGQTEYVSQYIRDQYLCKDKPFKGNVQFPTRQKRIVIVEIDSET
jgi:hypothetical protein